MRTNLHHLLEQSAAQRPDAPALTYKSRTATYAEVWSLAVSFAAGLSTLGLGRGERVGIYLDKRIETVAAIFGTSRAGGVFVPVNHILKAQQVGYILDNCDVKVLVTTPERLATLRSQLAESSSIKHVIVLDAPPQPSADGAVHAVHSWTDLIEADTTELGQSAAIDVDMAAILYTSGSTGKPKGVVLSHRNLIVGAESVSAYLKNTADDVILSSRCR